jgi:predicted heme/steroid binding protein
MTASELAKYDGKNGQPAYVAVSGVIYDVSASPMWQSGNHMDQHQAGQDLTEDLKSAPHVRKVVERFPTVGRLEEAPETPEKSSGKTVFIIIGVLAALVVGWLVLR